jgi:hypothetical protein
MYPLIKISWCLHKYGLKLKNISKSTLMLRQITLLFAVIIMCFGQISAQKYKTKKIFHLEAKSARFIGGGVAAESYFFKPSVELGFGIQYPLTSRVSFSPLLTISQRGFRGKTNFSDSTYTKRNITTQYLDINPNFEFKLGSLSEFGSGYTIWGGPYMGIGLWDKSTYEQRGLASTGKYVTTTVTGESFSRDIRRMDMGVKVGIGYVTQNFVSFGLTYQTGLINISTQPGELRNQSLGFYMRVFFDEIF